MGNHVHLALRTGEIPLSRVMSCLHSSYAEWFNRRHRRVGHLFQGRYKAFLVQEERYLHALVRYIHRNPVEAQIVQHPKEYPWSSDRYMRRGRGPTWLDVDSLLSLLGSSPRSAARIYASIVDGESAEPEYDTAIAHGQVVIGDEPFAVERFQAVPERGTPLHGFGLDVILDAVAREGDLTVADLLGPRPGGAIADARCRVAYIASRYARIPVRRVARRVGRDDSSFARPLARLESLIAADPAVAARIERIVGDLRARMTRQTASESMNQD
jgi:hypothetical protein